MLFFGKRKRMEHVMNMMQGLHVSSKASLKQFCLLTARGDVGEASKMYDFLIKGMEELPMFDPVKPTAMQNIKTTATDLFSFIKENQDGIRQGVALISGLLRKGGAAPAVPAESLPPING